MKLSIIIPAYNEAKRIAGTIETICVFLERKHLYSELILVNDGSTDDTLQIIKAYCDPNDMIKIISYNKNRGKGYAVRSGVLSATGDILLFLDADLSTAIEETESFLDEIDNYDVLIGSRRLKNSNIIKKQPFYRVFLGRLFSLFVDSIFHFDIEDTQCGYKMFKREPARNIFENLKIEKFSFDVEVLYLASKFNYRIKQLPVTWHNDADSSIYAVKDGMKMLLDLIKIKRNHSFDKNAQIFINIPV